MADCAGPGRAEKRAAGSTGRPGNHAGRAAPGRRAGMRGHVVMFRRRSSAAPVSKAAAAMPIRSAADTHPIAASSGARVIRAKLSPASLCANVHLTTGAVAASGSRRRASLPRAACVLLGALPGIKPIRSSSRHGTTQSD